MHLDPPQSRTFPQFCRLPAELRLRIWEYSLPGMRIVPVRCGADPQSGDLLACQNSPAATGCGTTAPCPTMLHICSESRREAARSYRRCFGFARRPGHMYFDPDRDVLYFGPRPGYMATNAQFRSYILLCDPAEVAIVRHIAISDSLFWIDNTWRSMTAATLTIDVLHMISRAMPHLEQITFVLREEDEERGIDLAHIQQRIQAQVSTAISTLLRQASWWKPPNWRVMTLQALRNVAAD